MNDRIILQIVRRGNQGLEFLVRVLGTGWELMAADCITPNLPIEAALRAAEIIFGEETVCTLWKLGSFSRDGITHYVFCLDQESVSEEVLSIHDFLWLNEQHFFQNLPQNVTPLMSKILLIK